MTVLANVLILLKFSTTSFKSKEPRFGRYAEGNETRKLYGFTLDDWFRGVYALLAFRYRRISNNRLDVVEGRFGTTGEIGYWQADLSSASSLLSAEKHDSMPGNKLALYGMKVAEFVHSVPAGEHTRP